MSRTQSHGQTDAAITPGKAARVHRAGTVRCAIIVIALLALEFACRTGLIKHITMVPPSVMVLAAVDVLMNPTIRASILVTLEEVLLATALSIVLGLACGFWLFAAPWARKLADPVLSAWYSVPIFVFYPVMIVLFGIGQQPIIAIAVVFSVAAMILSTVAALDRIPPALFKTARILQLSLPQRVAFVLLPAALPHLMVGLRLVVAYALIATIAGEFILSSIGIGHEIAFSYDNFKTDTMYGLILIVILAAIFLNMALTLLVQRMGGRVSTIKGATGG